MINIYKTIQWLFLISGFNLNYRGYLIDLIEYCCDINHFILLEDGYNKRY